MFSSNAKIEKLSIKKRIIVLFHQLARKRASKFADFIIGFHHKPNFPYFCSFFQKQQKTPRCMDYNFTEIEKKWQQYWRDNKIYKVDIDHNKPKFYVLDMFPYPSGAGLHVGHPLGYIASDIYARYKRLKGFNVLHPMGYDAYGLPAEQYAIQTGTHPAVTTEKNINRYREQMDKIGFCYDWEPSYYKWTQWTFLQLFKSFYCYGCQKAQPISKLIARFEEKGTEGLNVAESKPLSFTAAEWKAMSEKEQQEVLMNYRLAYQAEAMVNWCPTPYHGLRRPPASRP